VRNTVRGTGAGGGGGGGGEGGTNGTNPPLGSYPGKSGTYPGKFKKFVQTYKLRSYFLQITLILWEKRKKNKLVVGREA